MEFIVQYMGTAGCKRARSPSGHSARKADGEPAAFELRQHETPARARLHHLRRTRRQSVAEFVELARPACCIGNLKGRSQPRRQQHDMQAATRSVNRSAGNSYYFGCG